MASKCHVRYCNWFIVGFIMTSFTIAWFRMGAAQSNGKMMQISHQLQVLSSNTSSPERPMTPMYQVLKPYLQECNRLVKRNETSQKRNNVWHLQNTINGDVMVYSAFYDDRPCFNGQTFIRLLAVTSIVRKDNLFCQVWYSGLDSALISSAVSEDTGRGLKYKSVKYQERLYSCEIPRIPNIYPMYVSLSDAKCADSAISVPVVVPEKEQVHDVGVCVVVAYDDMDPVKLVEWFELNQILGITEFNVYDSRVGPKGKQVFAYYEQRGLLRVHEAAPSVNNWCKWCQKLTAIASLNDCMYRNMYRYKHMAVIDFDEFIMPGKSDDETVLDVMARARRTWQLEPPAYLFRNTYFFLDSAPASASPWYLVTSRFTARQNYSAFGYSPKSIVNPRRCMVMQNHYCMKRTPDVKGSPYLSVKPELACSHHYKKCHFKQPECERMVKHTVTDTSALQYALQLNETAPAVLKQLKLWKEA